MTEFEDRVRAMLRARAGDITDAPGFAPGPARRARHAVAWLAAAAVVVLVGAISVAIALTRPGGSPPPATSSHPPAPTVRHSPTAPEATPTTAPPTTAPPTTTPPTVAGLQALRCDVALPSSWAQQRAAHTVSVPGRRLVPLAITDAGDVIADQAADVPVPGSHSLALVTTGGKVRSLYDVAPPPAWHGDRIGSVSTSGEWVAFALLVQSQSGGQGPEAIELVNISTGARTTLRATTPNDATIVFGPVIFRGGVFWTLIDAGQGLMTGRVYRHDLASGRTAVVDSGLVTTPTLIAGGLYWTKNDAVVAYQPGTLPPGYQVSAHGKNRPFVSDGTTDVWSEIDPSAAFRLLAWRPGLKAPVLLAGSPHGADADGITGPFVWFGSSSVLDLRTGASTEIGPATSPGGSTARVATGHRTAAVALSGGGVAVLDTSTLPELRC